MPHRLEITLKPELFDAEGEGIRHKAADYFDIRVDRIRTVHILTIDVDLTDAQLETIRSEVFTNPVTQVSAYTPLDLPFDWAIWVGYRPGVRDNPGSTAVEAIEEADMKGGQALPGFEVEGIAVRVTIGISIVVADLMLWIWGGDFYQILTPDWLSGPVVLPLVTAIKSSTGEPVFSSKDLRMPWTRGCRVSSTVCTRAE